MTGPHKAGPRRSYGLAHANLGRRFYVVMEDLDTLHAGAPFKGLNAVVRKSQ